MSEPTERDGVRVVHDGPILRVTLADAERRNAQTPATWRRLAGIRDVVDDDTRAIVLDAEGKSFSAGLDRRMLAPGGVPGEKTLVEIAGSSPDEIDGFIREAQSAFTWWREVPQVTIALVDGHAIGAGFQLALACDVMVVGETAQLAMRETSLGLVPDLAGTQPLVDRVGTSRAFEICATGRFVAADEAVRLGIAIAKAPREEWPAWTEAFLAPILAAMPNAVGALKALLAGAGSAADQPARERAAQQARIAELSALLGG